MSLWTWLKERVRTETKQYVHQRIDDKHVDHAPGTTAATADQHYFRLTLAQMFLRHERLWGQELYPAVHSIVRCSFAGQTVEVPNVADASRLVAEQSGTGDVIARNFTLLPLDPFKGGEVGVAAGLFSVPGKNLLSSFLGVLGEFAGLLAVPQLSKALEVATPLAGGIARLLSEAGEMQLGYHDTFVGTGGTGGNELQEGWVALIHATEDEVDRDELYVVERELRTGTGLWPGEHEPFSAADFMLLHFELRTERDDWNQLTSIAGPFGAALDALADGDDDVADRRRREALVAARQAPELTRADRRRVIDLLKADYAEAQGDFGLRGAVPAHDEGYDLQGRMAHGALGVDEALELGEPTWDELL